MAAGAGEQSLAIEHATHWWSVEIGQRSGEAWKVRAWSSQTSVWTAAARGSSASRSAAIGRKRRTFKRLKLTQVERKTPRFVYEGRLNTSPADAILRGMKWAARLLLVTLVFCGSRPIFLSPSSACCAMGGNMSCCLLDAASGQSGCTLRACGSREDGITLRATPAKATLPSGVRLPEQLDGSRLAIDAETLVLLRSDPPSTPPPRA